MRMEDFEWNIDLDQRLFDPTPPEGYTDDTREQTPMDEQVRKISEALKIYAEASGGHYPRVKVVYGDVTRDELVTMLKIQWPPKTIEEMRDEKAAYYGKTVSPNDKDKVLLRWRLDDGRYEVIFGDLHCETVMAERLSALEGK